MRFFDFLGRLKRSPADRSGYINIPSPDQMDVEKLCKLLKEINERINNLEKRSLPEATEFEITFTNTAIPVAICHNWGCPIRWYVVRIYPTLSTVATSIQEYVSNPRVDNSKTLVLQATQTCRAVIRVEPSEYGTQWEPNA